MLYLLLRLGACSVPATHSVFSSHWSRILRPYSLYNKNSTGDYFHSILGSGEDLASETRVELWLHLSAGADCHSLVIWVLVRHVTC